MHEALQPGKMQIYVCTALQEAICQSGAINTLSYALFTLIASRPLLAQTGSIFKLVVELLASVKTH
jgi:hypothetical protein